MADIVEKYIPCSKFFCDSPFKYFIIRIHALLTIKYSFFEFLKQSPKIMEIWQSFTF